LTVAARLHQAFPAQQRKVLRYCRIPDLEELTEISDRPLGIEQLAQDQQPVPVAQRLQELGGPIGGLTHDGDVHFHSCVSTYVRIYGQAVLCRPVGFVRRGLVRRCHVGKSEKGAKWLKSWFSGPV
jgi:hypothetical protein